MLVSDETIWCVSTKPERMKEVDGQGAIGREPDPPTGVAENNVDGEKEAQCI
jgi:hypothetical protein